MRDVKSSCTRWVGDFSPCRWVGNIAAPDLLYFITFAVLATKVATSMTPQIGVLHTTSMAVQAALYTN